MTQNVAQYRLHRVTYSPVIKFEVATSNSLGGDAFTRKIRRTYVRSDMFWYEINYCTGFNFSLFSVVVFLITILAVYS